MTESLRSSSRPAGERSSVGHNCDVGEAELVLQSRKTGRAAVLCDSAQTEAREPGIRRDIRYHDDVLSRQKSQPVHGIRAVRDSCKQHRAWSPKCPSDSHHR